MKNIKQIRESYDLITEKEEAEDRKLATLVRAGLYDAKKLPALKKALEKSADKMTGQEKRMLLNLLDSLINQVVSSDQVFRKVKQNVQHMNEAKDDYLSKFDPRFKAGYPSDKEMPTVLILKRKAIRVYPDNQKVALYYSQAIDKYVTIPFSDIQTGINEETKGRKKTPEEKEREEQEKENEKLVKQHSSKWQSLKTSYNRISGSTATKLGGALGASSYYRKRAKALAKAAAEKPKEEPKSKPKAEPKAKEKPKAEAKATISVRSPEAAVANAKRIRNKNKNVEFMPKSIEHMSKAKTKLEENYKLKLQELREARQYGKMDAALDAASFVPGPAGSLASLGSAAASVSRGDYVGAALDVAGAVPGVGYAAKAAKVARVASKASNAVSKGGKITDAARLAKRQQALNRLKKAKGSGKWKPKKRRDVDVDVNVGDNNSSGNGGSSGSSAPNYVLPSSKREYGFKHTASGESSWKNRVSNKSTQDERDKQSFRKSQMSESVVLTLKNMVNNNISEQKLSINEQEININNTVAKKIINVYESVNSTNKKKMEKMLNESAESFTKVLTFAIRQ